MPPRNESMVKDDTTELLRDLLIAQLGMAGVPQSDIRQIAKCDMNRVNRIVSLIERARSRDKLERKTHLTKRKTTRKARERVQ